MSDQINFGADQEAAADERIPFLNQPYKGQAYLKDVEIDNTVGDDDHRVLNIIYGVTGPNEWPGFEIEAPATYRHTFWQPRQEHLDLQEDEDIPRVQRDLNRLAYEIKYFLPGREEEAAEIVQFQGASIEEAWDKLRNRVVEALSDHTYPELSPKQARGILDQRRTVDSLQTLRVDGEASEEEIDEAKAELSNLLSEHGDPKFVQIKVLASVWNDNPSVDMPNYLGYIADEESEAPVTISDGEKDNAREWADFQDEEADSSEDIEEEAGDLEF